MSKLFAEVAVNATMPHRQTFSYSVPQSLDVRAGHGVYVPFGRQMLQGIVLEMHDTPTFSEPEKIRPIAGLIGERRLLDDARIGLLNWLAEYYIAPIFDSASLFLPAGFERKPQVFIRPLVTADELDGLELTPRLRAALDVIVAAHGSSIDALRQRLESGADSAIANLERRGLVSREHALARPRVGAKTAAVVTLAVDAGVAARKVADAEPAKTSRRAALLERLLEKRRVSDEEAIRLAGSRANLDRLLRDGAVRFDREAHSIELGLARAEAITEAASLRRTKRAAEALAVIDALAGEPVQPVATLRSTLAVETATINWLGDIGVVETRDEAVERDPLEGTHVDRRPPARLLPDQSAAADEICHAIDLARPEVFLLHGVTGSGKTEVYLHALDHCVAQGKRAIVLVPEIALTPQTVRRFRERVGHVAVLHSGLSDGELFDQWHGIADGRFEVVIGPRSAIFAPQPDLGLIVVDEEHEWTYKQHDATPRYHARDVAIELARRTRAAVVLGSATPSVESFALTERGEYRLLSLPGRVRPAPSGNGDVQAEAAGVMPQVTVVDMREELHSGNRSMFSGELRSSVERALAADEQVILFLNRRGMAGHVQCRDCGYVPECSACFVALTYHRQYDRLVCHQCNRQSRLPVRCKQCDSPRVRLVGAGVEKVEAEAARAFPRARLLRWDRDVTRGRNAHDRILAAFLAHEADILIGTQMLAKGLDMPSVTFVGVVNADVGLHLPDFRAGERTFQLLTQVAGRAGRGERPGRVVIQTYQPDHYAIDAASRYDYDGFAGTELEARRANGYPPYARLVRMLFAHTNGKFAREEAARMARALELRRAEFGSDAEIIGPSPAYVPKVRGRWRWQLLLRGREPDAIVRGFLLPQGWIIDVDPVTVV